MPTFERKKKRKERERESPLLLSPLCIGGDFLGRLLFFLPLLSLSLPLSLSLSSLHFPLLLFLPESSACTPHSSVGTTFPLPSPPFPLNASPKETAVFVTQRTSHPGRTQGE